MITLLTCLMALWPSSNLLVNGATKDWDIYTTEAYLEMNESLEYQQYYRFEYDDKSDKNSDDYRVTIHGKACFYPRFHVVMTEKDSDNDGEGVYSFTIDDGDDEVGRCTVPYNAYNVCVDEVPVRPLYLEDGDQVTLNLKEENDGGSTERIVYFDCWVPNFVDNSEIRSDSELFSVKGRYIQTHSHYLVDIGENEFDSVIFYNDMEEEDRCWFPKIAVSVNDNDFDSVYEYVDVYVDGTLFGKCDPGTNTCEKWHECDGLNTWGYNYYNYPIKNEAWKMNEFINVSFAIRKVGYSGFCGHGFYANISLTCQYREHRENNTYPLYGINQIRDSVNDSLVLWNNWLINHQYSSNLENNVQLTLIALDKPCIRPQIWVDILDTDFERFDESVIIYINDIEYDEFYLGTATCDRWESCVDRLMMDDTIVDHANDLRIYFVLKNVNTGVYCQSDACFSANVTLTCAVNDTYDGRNLEYVGPTMAPTERIGRNQGNSQAGHFFRSPIIVALMVVFVLAVFCVLIILIARERTKSEEFKRDISMRKLLTLQSNQTDDGDEENDGNQFPQRRMGPGSSSGNTGAAMRVPVASLTVQRDVKISQFSDNIMPPGLDPVKKSASFREQVMDKVGLGQNSTRRKQSKMLTDEVEMVFGGGSSENDGRGLDTGKGSSAATSGDKTDSSEELETNHDSGSGSSNDL